MVLENQILSFKNIRQKEEKNISINIIEKNIPSVQTRLKFKL